MCVRCERCEVKRANRLSQKSGFISQDSVCGLPFRGNVSTLRFANNSLSLLLTSHLTSPISISYYNLVSYLVHRASCLVHCCVLWFSLPVCKKSSLRQNPVIFIFEGISTDQNFYDVVYVQQELRPWYHWKKKRL